MTTIRFDPSLGWPITVLLIVALAATLWRFTPATDDPKKRRFLRTLRVISAVTIMLAMLRPALVTSTRQNAATGLAIVVDGSRSMTLPHRGGVSRERAGRDVLRRLVDRFGDLPDLQLGVWVHGSEVDRIETSAIDDIQADRDATRLGPALTAATDVAADRPMIGVVMIGDGTQTAPPKAIGSPNAIASTETDPAAAAGRLAARRVPLLTVPLGQPDGGSVRDLAIESLPESFDLFADTRFEVPFVSRAVGAGRKTATIRLRWIGEEAPDQDLATRRWPVDGGATRSWRIDTAVPPPGTYRLAVSIDALDGEVTPTNNRQTALVRVRKGGGRVLYLEGSARAETLFIRRSLARFPDLDLQFRLLRPGDAGDVRALVRSADGEPAFECFILGDVAADVIGADNLATIADSVRGGAGLILTGGRDAHAAGGYAGSPLAGVLPVELPVAPEPADDADPVRPVVASDHPIVRGLDPPPDDPDLPPLAGADDIGRPRPLPGVTVVLEDDGQRPLMVVGNAGGGRVATLAFDSTWRWWRSGNDDLHRSFWRRLLLWAMNRDADDTPLSITVDPPRAAAVGTFAYEVSDRREDDAREPPRVFHVRPDDDRVPLGSPTGEIVSDAVGIHRLIVEADGAESAETSFEVTASDVEFRRPAADPALLRALSAITSEAGGRTYEPEDVDALIADLLQRRGDATRIVTRRRTLGDDTASAWIVYAIFAAALIVEWLLRKRWRLA